MTIGQLLIDEALPDEYKGRVGELNKKSLGSLLTLIAKTHPEQYSDVAKKLHDLGAQVSYESGSTIRLSDIMPTVPDRQKLFEHVKQQARKIKKLNIPEADKKVALASIFSEVAKTIRDESVNRGQATNNKLTEHVVSGSRGGPLQLAAVQDSPGFYTDANDNLIPVFIQRSFSEGLRPHEYWASTYGARKGVISTKFATQEGGDFGKQVTKASGDLIVTEDDCGTVAGIPVGTDDSDSIGSLLNKRYLNYPPNTPITKEVLADLKKSKIDEIVVRSPITCAAKNGLCRYCSGIRESGRLPDIRDHVGISAGSAIAERIAQGALNVKHTCLVLGTEVLMSDYSTKKIEEIQPGDTVFGSDITGNIRPVKVIRRFDNGPRECYRTWFRLGMTKELTYLESTLEHKILAMRHVTNQLEERLNNMPRILPVGTTSNVFNAVGIETVDTSELNLVEEPFALILGLLIGDGCYTEAVKSVNFSCADAQLIEQLKDYLVSINFSLVKLAGHDYYYRLSNIEMSKHETDEAGQYIEDSGKNTMKEYLEKHGMYGKYAYEKELPICVNTWNNSSVAKLIAGLIITDGSIYIYDKKSSAGISFVSTSKRLVEQLRYLLKFRFGIHTTNLTKVANAGKIGANGFNFNYDQWQITITNYSSVCKFAKYIPLLGAKKDKLDLYLQNYSSPKKNSSYYRMYRTKQEFIGMLPTYDIEVDHPDHLFVLANGLIVSNSGQKADKQQYGGFPILNQLAQVQKQFPHRASVAELDGFVKSISPAPQGGYNIVIGDKTHYIDPEQEVTVTAGQKVEAGDVLSTGIANPAEIVQYKGIGEGRRYFMNRFAKAMNDSGLGYNRRNIEVVSRALIDKVVVDDEDGLGDFLPGDEVSYSNLAHTYRPREGSQALDLSASKGKYLEQPILHYSIGTRLTDNVLNTLKKHGEKSVFVNDTKPAFSPEMIRLRAGQYFGKDWIAKLWTSNLKANLLKDVHMGGESNIHGTHPIPAVAYGLELGESKPGKVTF